MARFGVLRYKRRMTILLHKNDLPASVTFGPLVAVDGEMMGLNPHRDRLCLVQLFDGQGDVHIVQFDGKDYSAPNLKKLLTDPATTKIFHVAVTDLAHMRQWLGVRVQPVFCTKIASRLCRTYTSVHGMKEVIKELVGVEIKKALGSSDWGAPELTKEQLEYAAEDVLYLNKLHEVLVGLLKREGRYGLAMETFAYLPARAELDLAGFDDALIRHH
jgi:ribonuclease D